MNWIEWKSWDKNWTRIGGVQIQLGEMIEVELGWCCSTSTTACGMIYGASYRGTGLGVYPGWSEIAWVMQVAAGGTRKRGAGNRSWLLVSRYQLLGTEAANCSMAGGGG